MIVLFGFAITASEFYYKIKNMQFLWPVKESTDSRRIRKCIPDDVYENLPVVSWEVSNKNYLSNLILTKSFYFKFKINYFITVYLFIILGI